MKIISIVGARPQFIKVVPIVKAFQKISVQHRLIHTGQHYDYELSKIFFDELKIPEPHYHLNIKRKPSGQTAEILSKLDKILLQEKPDSVMVYGDTTSTLAGALAAAKLNIPVAHVEAGLRSYRIDMPEENNRVLTDHLSRFHFCPTKTSVENLKKENIHKAFLVGDVMLDIFKKEIGRISPSVLKKLNLKPRTYYLLTIHRQQNADSLQRLKKILHALSALKENVIFPVHPRTKKNLSKLKKSDFKNIRFIKPVSYSHMLTLERFAKKILTDSGGVQKEAYFLKVPCVTLRQETEWIETLRGNWNILAPIVPRQILKAIHQKPPRPPTRNVFGNGKAAEKIVRILTRELNT